ncbi:MAG: glycosyltransferase family 4 protein [Candidatus Saccharimonadales bacterium]
MRILHTVEYYYPSVGGAQEVVRQISERLVRLGHEVTVATTKLPERKSLSHNGVRIVEFAIEGNAVRGIKGEKKKYQDFLRKGEFDVIMNYAAQQWATDLAFEIIDELKTAKVLVPCGFSGLYDPSYKTYFKNMPSKIKQYDASVYLSDDYRDINFARTHHVSNTHLIPNGAGADEFDQQIDFSLRQKLGIPRNNFLILTVGSHTGLKGHSESIKIFEQANINKATLLIIANDFGVGCISSCKEQAQRSRRSLNYLRRRKQLLVKDLPRVQTVAAYKEADLFLFPSNIEASPLVLFEAMAGRTPYMTTDVGNAKEIIKWSSGGLLLPTFVDDQGLSHADIPKAIDLLENLHNKPRERQDLATKGYKAWKKRFTWEIITQQYEKLYRSLVA